MTLIVRLSIILSTIVFCDSARILAVYPAPCYSHQLAFRPLTLELVRQGHQVTVITPFPAYPVSQTPENLTEVNIYEALKNLREQTLVEDLKDATDIITQQRIVFKVIVEIYDLLFGKELKDFINSEQKFDLVLAEACARSSIVFSHIFKAPLIQISSYGGTFDTFHIVGAPIHPLLYPLAIREKFKNLTMVDKIKEMYQHYVLVKMYYDMEEHENAVIKRHLGADFPSLQELANNIDMIFLNVHPIWDSNRPVPPNLVYLGGLQLQKEKELPKELKSQLDESRGAIYMSFGSTVSPNILSREKIDMFLRVLSKLPYTVFWKWDADVKSVPNNVIVGKWFPQADLLRHPKMKLFITQGGLQSIDEAVDAGVPMIGIPILWDQWYNVDKMVELKIGVMCNILSVSEDDFKTALDDVLTDQSYRENVKQLHEIINDQPQTSVERAVWWIEHVLRHKGAKYLKSPASNISATDYYEMELVLSVLFVFLVCIIIIIISIKYVLFNRRKLKTE